MNKLAILSVMALLAACGQKAETPPTNAPEAAAPAEPSLATATRSVSYVCERDLDITAVYGTNKEGKKDVGLVFKGDSWTLEEVPTAKGQRFESVYGLDSLSGKGLVWLVDGTNAQLQEAPWKQISDPAAATTLRTCREKSEADAPKIASGETVGAAVAGAPQSR